MKLSYQKLELKFKRAARTSRGEMLIKNGYLLFAEANGIQGVGECSFIEGLSADPLDKYKNKLEELCHAPDPEKVDLSEFPSIKFGLEIAMRDLQNGGKKLLYPSTFTNGKKGIAINGLLWMGSKDFIMEQLQEKLTAGFQCIKMKIGGLDFQTECEILEHIRKNFSAEKLELRLDANGAFSPSDAIEKLNVLSHFNIHSIEQPIAPKQWQLMRELCDSNIIPVALDEELIGNSENKVELLETIRPQYIILKPSLLGGFGECESWISAAREKQIGWWATSALESNIGLNAIAQWVFEQHNPMPQGLGTGSLYENNIAMPLKIIGGELWYQNDQQL
ncbi:MAG: o-succinylbenzoate synthase [Chitinophagales bacterium]